MENARSGTTEKVKSRDFEDSDDDPRTDDHRKLKPRNVFVAVFRVEVVVADMHLDVHGKRSFEPFCELS
jgi:hypothetical protein